MTKNDKSWNNFGQKRKRVTKWKQKKRDDAKRAQEAAEAAARHVVDLQAQLEKVLAEEKRLAEELAEAQVQEKMLRGVAAEKALVVTRGEAKDAKEAKESKESKDSK